MRVRALTILAFQNILYLISFDSLGSGFNVFSSDHGGFFPGVWNSSTSHPVPKRRSFLVHGISGLLQTILSGPWRTLFGCSRYKLVFRFDNRGITGDGYHFVNMYSKIEVLSSAIYIVRGYNYTSTENFRYSARFFLCPNLIFDKDILYARNVLHL